MKEKKYRYFRITVQFLFFFSLYTVSLSADDTIPTGSRFLNLLKGNEHSPYRLHWGIDLGITAGCGSLYFLSNFITSNYEQLTADDLSRFSPEQVNSFDRWAIGPTNENIDFASWVTNACIVNYMWIMFLGKESRRDFTKVLAMYAEAYLMYPLAQKLTHPVFARKRPYFYSDEESVEKRLGGMAQTSFVSGHVNYAFCFAVMTPILFSNYYPESPLRFIVWSVSLSTAVATAALRVAGHYHFPTDVIGGAVTGSLIGWYIPFMHKKRSGRNRVAITPQLLNDGSRGLALTLRMPSRRTINRSSEN